MFIWLQGENELFLIILLFEFLFLFILFTLLKESSISLYVLDIPFEAIFLTFLRFGENEENSCFFKFFLIE